MPVTIDEISKIFTPDYHCLRNIPDSDTLINPLLDILPHEREQDELTEFYKLSNPFYSPVFGIKYMLGIDLFPFQMSTILAMLKHKFPLLLMTRGGVKTFILAVYALYHAIMFPYSRIILVSATFRQSRLIFQEVEKMYKKSPLLQQMVDFQPKHNQDNWVFGICGSTITALPMGDGSKIRGERGHLVIADEFNSIQPETFDIVVRGFAATHLNPWERYKSKLLGIEEEEDADISSGNKIVLAGTAGFNGDTFYKMFNHYSKIIAHRVTGLVDEHTEVFDLDELTEGYEVDYKDYCIVRYNCEEVPIEMLDIKMISAAKAAMPKQLFNMEYMTLFADDSQGFFKPRDIREATSREFSVKLIGRKDRHYVLGIDPARTLDRFAIVVIELGAPHKVVYVWTAQNEKYAHCAAKIRQLCPT